MDDIGPGQQKGRTSRIGPDLQFPEWRGEDLNLRPSGYEPYPKRPHRCSSSDTVYDRGLDLDFHALNTTEQIPSYSQDSANVGIL